MDLLLKGERHPNMFEKYLITPKQQARYDNGPLATERLRYMNHLEQEGRGHSRLTAINARLLAIASEIDPSSARQYSSDELRRISEAWHSKLSFKGKTDQSAHIAKTEFHFVASGWLEFLGRMKPLIDNKPNSAQVNAFVAYLEHDLGYAEATRSNRRRTLEPFMHWLAANNTKLTEVSSRDITSYFTSANGRWGRTTVSQHVQSLRSFFRYAAKQGWCSNGIAETIDAPRLYIHENLPQGPSWAEVQKLLESSAGESIRQIRQRCFLVLLAVYGLRAGEVCHLRLEDLDWTQDKIHIRRPKQCKSQTYPLTSTLGNALLNYLRVRPQSPHREIFLTLKQPYRRLSVGGFSTLVMKQQKAVGLKLRQYGSHVLRHSCATHLLAEGFSLKEVGDHLGHDSAAATRIYAKVDLNGLRKVSCFSLFGLDAFVQSCEQSETPFYDVGDPVALREVARLSLEGLL
jgi:integrase/recombinase XerD